jgi:hypothetical protein
MTDSAARSSDSSASSKHQLITCLHDDSKNSTKQLLQLPRHRLAQRHKGVTQHRHHQLLLPAVVMLNNLHQLVACAL